MAMANRKLYQKLYQDNPGDPRHPVYVGGYYQKNSGIPAKQYKMTGLGLSALLLLLLALSGSVTSAQSKTFYSAITYAVMFLPAIYTLLGWLKAPNDEQRIQEDQYEESFVRVQMWSAIGLGCSGVAAVTAGIVPVVSGIYGIPEVIYLFGIFGTFCVFWAMRKLRMRQCYQLQTREATMKTP